MKQLGQVTEYNTRTGEATIIYARPDACDKCGACGTSSKTGSIRLHAQLSPGNWVRVELPDNRFIKATALAYGMPLVALLIGLGVGFFLGGTDLWALLGGLITLGFSVLILHHLEKRMKQNKVWTPHIAQVYEQKPSPDVFGCSQGN